MKRTIVAALIVVLALGLCTVLLAADKPQTPVWVTTAVAPNFFTGQVTVTSSATKIVDAPTATGPTARSLHLTNTGSVPVWIGKDNTVTTLTGKSIAAGQTLPIDRTQLSTGVWGIVTSTSGTVDYILQ
jgi:hypothetical protein